jgi:predicted phage-related endonuclease
MTITYHPNVEQGGDKWHDQRRARLTASEMKLILTPTLKVSSNDKERSHLFELAAQSVTGYTEPRYVSDDMLRGQVDEITARALYAENFTAEPVTECGFVTRDFGDGVVIGYSPDGLVGDAGLIECKSRRQKFQLETIIAGPSGAIPEEYVIQCQTGLLVTGREWLDFVSYCGGMPMVVIRVYPDAKIQAAILEAATAFYGRMLAKIAEYQAALTQLRWVPTERTVEQEMVV